MTVTEIVARVRSAIDEQMDNDSGFLSLSSDEANLTSTIIDKIRYALIYIIENAPDDKLDSGMVSKLSTTELSGVTITAGSVVRVKVPSDVLRILSSRLSSWSLSPVPVTEYSQEYLMQQDAYAKGSWDRPVTALVYDGTDRYLELYSAKTTHDTVKVSCIRMPNISDASTLASNMNTNVSVPSRLEGAFIYQIAALTMVAFRENIASSLFQIAQRYLTITQQNENK